MFPEHAVESGHAEPCHIRELFQREFLHGVLVDVRFSRNGFIGRWYGSERQKSIKSRHLTIRR